MSADISVTLTYGDPRAAIDWLERAFGFERGMVVEDGDRIVHAELWYGNDCVMLGGEGHGQTRSPGTGSAYVVVEDTDAHHARAKGAGAEIVMDLIDTDYGSRDYAAHDPEGNVWNFGTYRPSRP